MLFKIFCRVGKLDFGLLRTIPKQITFVQWHVWRNSELEFPPNFTFSYVKFLSEWIGQENATELLRDKSV